MSIFEYFKELRMQIACVALLAQDMNINDAAKLASYQSQANFSTAFKAGFNMQSRNARKVRGEN